MLWSSLLPETGQIKIDVNESSSVTLRMKDFLKVSHRLVSTCHSERLSHVILSGAKNLDRLKSVKIPRCARDDRKTEISIVFKIQ